MSRRRHYSHRPRSHNSRGRSHYGDHYDRRRQHSRHGSGWAIAVIIGLIIIGIGNDMIKITGK